MKLILGPIALGAMLVAAAPAEKPDPRFAARDAGPGTIDVSGYPDDQQRSYALFAAKCSKCHPLARPINSRFSGDEWKRYMKKMIRRPNSGINEEQAAVIYGFLVYYSTHRAP
jgi:hypothetical protein